MQVEQRSIEFIPENERYGSPKRLLTIWFSSNLQVTTLVVGTLGIVGGLNLLWTFIALMIGTIIGTIFMALHSAQGPKLGVPQMIQSRAQFGVIGAGFPLFIVFISYVLFTAANGVIMRDSIKAMIPLSDNEAIIGFGVITLIIAFIGYEFIHKLGAILTVLSGVIFAIVAVMAMKVNLPVNAWTTEAAGFKSATFMLVVSQAASWTLGFGPYVADYSRYLPKDSSDKQVFWYSYVGNLLGSTLIMFLGALLAAGYKDMSAGIASNPGGAIANMFGGASTVIYFIIIAGVLQINVLNLYSGYMSFITIFSGFKGMNQITQKTKFIIMALVAAAATAIALGTQYNFFEYFTDILIAQIYFLVPWSAINLVDFYAVRDGNYSVKDIFDVNGIYGKYNWATIFIYISAVIICIPFMQLSFYVGPIAKSVGADISWMPALFAPGLFYFLYLKMKLQKAA
ncbi:cytosine permease [Leeia sp. TBRC 13508]|uniref:Cytosine permease n=1 Tax=Leeia speluncae TaxID=2884804 RepID=A0ABS8D914_9NEIS|nr:cytosine permease [Leeia speluncae]MCB6184686.1 cytosine permease [Leeia speluncae]